MSQWPLHKSYFWERLPFFRLLLPFVAGVLCYEFVAIKIPAAAMVSIAITSLCIFSVSFFIKKQTSFKNALVFICANLFLLSAAWLIAYGYDIRNDKQWFGHYVQSAEAFDVKISDNPVEKERTWKLPVTVQHTLQGGEIIPAKGKAFLYIYKDESPLPYKAGDKLIVLANWQKIKNAGNPFEFNYARYAARNNLYYQQFLAAKDVMLYKQATHLSWWVCVHNWAMAQLAHFIKDKPTLGLIQAMLIGDDANMDTDLRQAYAETGIIHIVAISGSHIAIFFLIVTFLLGWVRNKKYHWLKYLLAIPLIWMYVLIAGAPPSAVRAACMFSLLGVGFSLQKQHNSLNQLLATAFILLVAQPYWLFAVGFQLSFLAVLSIVLFYPPLYKLWIPTHKITRALWGAVAVSIAAEILIAPLVIYYFHLFPAMFLIANIAAYLFMGVVLVSGMLIIASSSIPPIASFFAMLATWLAGVFNQLVYFFRHFNPDSFSTLLLTGFELLCIYFIITSIAVYIFHKKKPLLFTALIACCILTGSFISRKYETMHRQALVVYNISRINHVELINGDTYTILATDTAAPAPKKNYTLKPAHIGFGCHTQLQPSGSNLFRVGNYTVLLLSAAPQYPGTFPVDYVLVNYNAPGPDMQSIKNMFNPRKVILGNTFTRRRQSALAQAAAHAGLPLHITGWDGAFTLIVP